MHNNGQEVRNKSKSSFKLRRSKNRNWFFGSINVDWSRNNQKFIENLISIESISKNHNKLLNNDNFIKNMMKFKINKFKDKVNWNLKR